MPLNYSIGNEPSVIKKFQQEHPIATTAAKVALGTGLVIGGTTVLAPAIVVGALNAVGFTASGVVGGGPKSYQLEKKPSSKVFYL